MSISSILSTAVSGLLASSEKVHESAHNIANVNTDGYLAEDRERPQVAPPLNAALPVGASTVQIQQIEPSNVNLGKEFIDMMAAKAAYEANIEVIETAEEMVKSALDIEA